MTRHVIASLPAFRLEPLNGGRGHFDSRRMVRFHPLSVFRDGPQPSVFRRWRRIAAGDPWRVRHRLSDAAPRRDLFRAYGRPHWAAPHAAAIGGDDDRGDVR